MTTDLTLPWVGFWLAKYGADGYRAGFRVCVHACMHRKGVASTLVTPDHAHGTRAEELRHQAHVLDVLKGRSR